MSKSKPGTPSYCMALDLILKTFMNSREFNEMQDKNWDAIAKLVPGSNSKMVAKRFEELQKQAAALPGDLTSISAFGRSLVPSSRAQRLDNDNFERNEHRSRPASAKVKGSRVATPNKSRPTSSSSDQGPLMVIKVCDEAKNLKQDFHCPRDLLVNEMKYFAEYLSNDVQRLEDVEISVHCDVQIFDWLMKYAKRGNKERGQDPKLEPSNVISILISSDFLKMDSLVELCIKFCHDHMNAILSAPSNMNCISDRLVTSIAELFDHNELDGVRDRKDKFKNKLFAKKIEKLFDPNISNSSSPENASTLYRCSECKRLLTKSSESRLRCSQKRMSIDRNGDLSYTHSRDTTWDVNEYLLDLKKELNNWRDVYWRVWGTINFLNCSRCGEVFQCCNLGHCQYHTETAKYPISAITGKLLLEGVYTCCNGKAFRFDPVQPVKGCATRDHIVSLPSAEKAANDPVLAAKLRVYEDLLHHRDMIEVKYVKQESNIEDEMLTVFDAEEKILGLRESQDLRSRINASASSLESNKVEDRPQPGFQPLVFEREMSYDIDPGFGESDDEIGDDELPKKPRVSKQRVVVDPKAIVHNAPDFGTTKNHKWDSNRPVRWNQDAQREEDHKRMQEIVQYLTRLRLNSSSNNNKQRDIFLGGMFCKIEAQWKAANLPPMKGQIPGQLRSKPRPAPIRNSVT